MKSLIILSVSAFIFMASPARATGEICNFFGLFSDWYKSEEVEKPAPRREAKKPVQRDVPASKWQEFKKKSEPKVVKVKEEPKKPWYSKWLSPQSRGANHDGYREYTDERTKTYPID